jgi:predicted AlkP superfamily phosphohydrolase/phosphomutase
VRPEDYHKIREELIRLLQDLRDPETGERITDKVFRREDLYSGEFLSKAPDIIFTQPNNTYTYMLRGSKTDRNLNTYLETIPESELGVWPTSGHTLDGVFFLKGGKVNRGKWINGARIIDLAPTILYLMGLPIPNDMDGAVIQDAIDPDFLGGHPPEKVYRDKEEKVEMVSTSGYTEEEQAKIQERLKDLGYIE